MNKRKIVYIVSDSVGETAELMVKAVLTQFSGEDIEIQNTSYVENEENIDNIIAEARCNEAIIAYTIVIPPLKQYLDQSTLNQLA